MKRVSLSKYVKLALRRADYEKGESFDCVVAEALDLPGCLTQGRTFEEARENLKDAIELWITVCLSKDVALLRRLLRRAGLTVKEWNDL